MKKDAKGLRMIALTGLLLTGILITSGCPQQGPGLEGTLWKLDSYMNSEGNMVNVLASTEITAKFENGMVSGFTGCNQYWADYQINNDAITTGNFIKNSMLCPDIQDQEEDYLAALQSAASYKIKGNTLEITNAGGVVILIFEAA